MIDLYTWPTPNGHKIHIMLEECGLPYTVHAIDIGAGDQFDPEFLKISPNNKMPALVDPDGPDGAPISIFESGAILIYLADKTGRLLPSEPRARFGVLQWLMFQMGSIGPMLGQAHHFLQYAPVSLKRFVFSARRLVCRFDRAQMTSRCSVPTAARLIVRLRLFDLWRLEAGIFRAPVPVRSFGRVRG